MRKSIGVLLLVGIFTGCSDNSVTMVKKGTLEIDKSLTVGQAIDNYKYFRFILEKVEIGCIGV